MPIQDLWKDYLCNRSGSITEYYQLYKGYEQIEHYANQQHIIYDLFLRTRCDILISQPLSFDGFQYSSQQIEQRYLKIKALFPNASPAHWIALYLSSIPLPLEYAVQRITNPNLTLESFHNKCSPLANLYEEYLNPSHSMNPSLSTENATTFIEMMLPNTRITYRQNLFYMGMIRNKRTEKDIILNYTNLKEKRKKYIYCTYTNEKTVEEEKEYWFNAENIYQKNIVEKGLLIINSNTEKEEKSLYDRQQGELFSIIRR